MCTFKLNLIHSVGAERKAKQRISPFWYKSMLQNHQNTFVSNKYPDRYTPTKRLIIKPLKFERERKAGVKIYCFRYRTLKNLRSH